MALAKKLLSVFFSLVLVMGLLPYSAFAASSDSNQSSVSSSNSSASNKLDYVDGRVVSDPGSSSSGTDVDSDDPSFVSNGEGEGVGFDGQFSNEQELLTSDYSEGRLAIWADGLDDPSDIVDIYPPDTNEVETYSNASNLQPMNFSSEMLYFCKYESSCNYDQGLSSGDGYHAMGYFQFDNRYGLGSFLKAVYNYNPSTYSSLKVIGDRYGWNVTGATRSNGTFTQMGSDLNTAWHAAYKANPTEFSNLQNGWAYIDSYDGSLGARGCLKAFGINLDNRPDCIKGLCWGMVNLFGAGGGSSYIDNGEYYGANWFFKNSGINDSMSDTAFVTTLCDYVVNNVSKRYPKQSVYWTGWQNRYKSEKSDCLNYLSSNEYTIAVFQDLPNASVDVDEGKYVIASALGGRNVLQLDGAGSVSNSALSIGRSDMGTDQVFSFEKDSATGLMRIRSAENSNYLSLNVSGSKMSPNVSARAYSADDRTQLWLVEEATDGTIVICAALNKGYCLDVSGASSSEGTKVSLYAKNSTAAQSWVAYNATPNVQGGRTIDDGIYSVIAKSDPSKALASSGSSDGSNVQLSDADGSSSAQRFRFELGADGFYTVTNLRSGKVLDVADGSVLPGSNVQQWSGWGGDAQKWAVRDNGDGSYSLICKANGLALDLNGTASGSNAQAWTLSSDRAQSFSLEPAAGQRTVADGTYVVSTGLDRGKVLDIAGGSTSDSARVQIYESNMTNAQAFRFSFDEQTGYYEIVNVGSGKSLDAAGGSSADGTRVQQYSSNGTMAQRWSVVADGDGYRVCSALDGSKALDVKWASSANGTDVQLYGANGSAAQRFYLCSKSPVVASSKSVDNGVYFMKLNSDPSKALASSGSSDGSNVQLSDADGSSSAQRFRFELGADGFYTVTNLRSGKVLDVADGSVLPGSNVQQWSGWGGDAQKWAVRDNGDGSYSLICKANGLALDLNGTASGSNAQAWTLSSDRAQSFSLEPAAGQRTVADGTYVVSTGLDRGKVLDIAGGSTSDSARVQIYESNMTNAQAFRFSFDEQTGYYEIVNVGSGKSLDAAGGSSADGTRVQQYSSNGTMAQRWSVVADGDGYRVCSALDGSKALDVKWASSANGTDVQLYGANGSAAQRFYLTSTEHEPVLPCDNLGLDGWYEIVPSGSGDLCVDISGASKADGAQVQLYNRNQTLAQLFKFEYSDGFYRLVSMNSGKVIGLKSGSVVSGTPAVQASKQEAGSQQFSVKVNSDGTYTFTCVADALSLSCPSLEPGASIVGREADSEHRSFKLEKRDYVLPEGLVSISSSLDADKVLDVADASESDGANVQLYSSNGTFAQKWMCMHVDGKANVYRFESLCSGKSLAECDSNVCVASSNTSAKSQMWLLAGISSGAYSFVNLESGKSLDVHFASTSNGTNIQTYEYNGSKAQQFYLQSVSSVAGGTYVIHSKANHGQVLDVKFASTESGANVWSYESNNSGAQKWNVISNGDGTYRIENAPSKKVLDVSNGSAVEDNNVQQYAWNGSAAQKWYITYGNSGGFYIESALNRAFVLSLDGASPANGINYVLKAKDSSAAQLFSFEKTTYTPPVPSDRQAMQNRIWGCNSGTQWLIGVDRSTHKVGVFRGSANNWSLQYWWDCVTGAPSTPTITGYYRTTGGKRTTLSTDSRAKWCTQIWNGYFFHTILDSDAELGNSLSHGCLRMSYPSAQWIYNNIYAGTAVVIYN